MPASTPPPWQITDEALAVLDGELARPAPERGAALLAPADSRLVVDVVVDPVVGETASYWHSARLGRLLNRRLKAEPLLRYVGTSHSHPGGMAWPSAPDHEAFRASVEASGLEAGLFPVVVGDRTDALRMPERYGEQHLVDLPHGTLAPYTWRASQGLDACRLAVMPLRGSITAALKRLAGELDLTAGPARTVAGVGTAWLLVPLDGVARVDLLVSQSYPETAPLLRVGSGAFVAPAWDLATPLAERLAGGIRARIVSSAAAVDAKGGIRARIGHHVPDGPTRTVAILGCGSVGSTVAELLVRGGVESFVLADPDRVSAANLSRGTYTAVQVGLPKVEALADRLRQIAPHARVAEHPRSLGAEALEVLADVDLAIMATDDPAAEAWHSHVLYAAGVPYVSAKLFAKADAGEITFVLPEAATACVVCATGMTTADAGRGAADYGTGRLEGEPALGSDVAAVAARATKVGLALLHRRTPGPLADWIVPLVSAQRTLNLSCSVAGWGLFEQVAVAPMDGPFASLWVQTASRRACPVCGDHPTSPEAPLGGGALPDELDDILAALAEEDSDTGWGSVAGVDDPVTTSERN